MVLNIELRKWADRLVTLRGRSLPVSLLFGILAFCWEELKGR